MNQRPFGRGGGGEAQVIRFLLLCRHWWGAAGWSGRDDRHATWAAPVGRRLRATFDDPLPDAEIVAWEGKPRD
jgi:hypothetical protein